MSIPEGAQFCIREVWQRNLRTEFANINMLKDKFRNISIDTEFPGVISLPFSPAGSLDELRYLTLKSNVDNMKLIQLGLTLMDERGNLPVVDGAYCVWQFNFRDFDITKDIYSPPSIDLLVRSGINFDKNRRDGVDACTFGRYLMNCKLVCNRRMRYICFSGDYDFAYLLKILTGALLPPYPIKITLSHHIHYKARLFAGVQKAKRKSGHNVSSSLRPTLHKFIHTRGLMILGAAFTVSEIMELALT